MGVTDNLPPTNEGYGTREYWEQRYTNEAPETTFDWFLSPQYLLPFLVELLQEAGLGKEARILMLGCGNSALGEVMYDAGYKQIVNIDYSKAVIDQMAARHTARPEMTWLEMDIFNLQFEEEFDLVIDKGTMEYVCLICPDLSKVRVLNQRAVLTTKGDPWNPPQKDVDACNLEITEALRVLRKRPSSRFVYFTFGQPHFRKRYMQDRPGWKLTHREIGPPEGFAYFQYLLTYTGDSA